jgi:uncharacterized protein (DUF1697 family)
LTSHAHLHRPRARHQRRREPHGRDGRSVLQSGNLVFETTAKPAAAERRLEGEVAARLGLQTDFFVRTAREWRELVTANPFPREAGEGPSHLAVMALKATPAEAAVQALRNSIVGRERIVAAGRHLYMTYPDGFGRSRLTGGLIEKTLGTRGTARNWNTVLRLAALVDLL